MATALNSVSDKQSFETWQSAKRKLKDGSFTLQDSLNSDGSAGFATAADMIGGEGTTLGADAIMGPTSNEVGHNGSGDPVVAVGASGDIRIDAQIIGTRWSDGSITYSFPDNAFDYQNTYAYDDDGDGISVQSDTFSAFGLNQRRAAHTALNEDVIEAGAAAQRAGAQGNAIEAFTNLSVSSNGVGVGTGTIRFANSEDPRGPGNTAYAFYPSAAVTGGDAWFDDSGTDAAADGNYHWATILHEVGHSMGLKHGHETGGFGALPSNVDSMEYSIMTYRSYIGAPLTGYTNEVWGYAQTYMMMDIAALQYMYGADFTTSWANAGNTTYTWNPNTGQSFVDGELSISPGGNRIFQTLWDGNGNDTYNLSNYTTNLRLDLRPGEHSTFSAAQLANLGGGPNGGFARGNVFNALQFQGDARSLIENAIGGSGNDNITGNAANNYLEGGTGNDTMTGLGGNDTYSVNSSSDVVVEAGGAGSDVVYSSAANYTISANIESLVLTGSANLNGTGNNLGNYIFGNAGANYINGAGGADVMVGGAGNDTYTVDNSTDVVSEFVYPGTTTDAGGIDVVYTTVDYAMGSFVEALILTSGAVYGIGSSGNNTIYGSAGINVIEAKGGNDTVYGFGSTDYFAFYATPGTGFGIDYIADFTPGTGAGHDVIVFSSSLFANYNQMIQNASQQGAHVMIQYDSNNTLIILNTALTSLPAEDFMFV